MLVPVRAALTSVFDVCSILVEEYDFSHLKIQLQLSREIVFGLNNTCRNNTKPKLIKRGGVTAGEVATTVCHSCGTWGGRMRGWREEGQPLFVTTVANGLGGFWGGNDL